MNKKQSKADKAFIAKIATLNFNTSTGTGSAPKAPPGLPQQVTCPDCGLTATFAGVVAVPVLIQKNPAPKPHNN